jgi:hypothetical protein
MPRSDKLLADGTVMDIDDVQKVNKKILMFLKFSVAPQELQIVFDESFPNVYNQSFNDIKYLKKTNEAVR